MSNNNNTVNQETVDEFIATIREIVRQEIEKNNAKLELHYDGIVKNADTGTGLVNVDIGSITLEGLKNRSGEVLAENDTVRVYAASNTLIDAYVGVKLS